MFIDYVYTFWPRASNLFILNKYLAFCVFSFLKGVKAEMTLQDRHSLAIYFLDIDRDENLMCSFIFCLSFSRKHTVVPMRAGNVEEEAH